MSGYCRSNKQFIIARHNRVKHHLTRLLTERNFLCFEEVHGYDANHSNRFIDIVAIESNGTRAFLVDPTVRYETNADNQDNAVQTEKASIYNDCIAFYKDKYSYLGQKEWEVRGLWFGARGTLGQSTIDFFELLKLDSNELVKIANNVLIDTVNIIHKHIYF